MKLTHGDPLKDNKGDKAWCAFRCVVFVNGVYYFFSEGFRNDRWEIYIRLSEDGITLKEQSSPIFPAGAKGSFDECGQADPTVTYENGKWYMWFDALNGEGVWDKLGFATSDDGLNWINRSPVIGRGNGWDSKAIHHPCCIKHENKYYLYYSATDRVSGNVKNIGLATSDDGIFWTKKESPILTVGDWDYDYIRPSCPVLVKGLWYMFYWAFGDNHYMGLAASQDLVHWAKQNKVLESSVPHEGITASQPLWVGDELRIYYATFDDIHVRMTKVNE
jgi:predicted GH43/DUF377 family glycosyl hydrolase